MRTSPIAILALLLIIQVNVSAQQSKVQPPANATNRVEDAATKFPVQQIPLSFEIPAGGNPVQEHTPTEIEFMPFITTPEAQEIKDAKLLHKSYNTNTHTSTSRITPVIGASFEANVSVDETPSSNTIAVSNEGIIISANNDGVIYFNENGARLYEAKWDDFFNDNNLNASFFSPRVLYDPVQERFILVVLHGKTSATSRVIISFSKTNNPENGWNVYRLSGNPLGDGSWFDFPSIGISANEVYVSGNLIEGTIFKKAIVYQINKLDGYEGSVLDLQFWTDFFNNPISLTPASHGQDDEYGPGIYLVSSAAAGDDAYWFWDLTDDIGSNPELTGYIIPSQTYSPPADALQAGTTDKLETGDSRTTNAFYLDGIIHFVLNIDVGGGFSGISYNRLSVPQQNVTTTHFGEPGGADNAHAGVASFATSPSDRSVMISLLRTSATAFPEFRVVNVDNGMSWSSATLVKGGETFVDRLPASVEPWGQYTGIARRHNSVDPRTWASGSYGANIAGQIDHTYKSRVAEVTNGQNVSTNEIENSISFSVTPNPIRDYFEINFAIKESFPMTIAMYDVNGKFVNTLYEGTPVIGENKVVIQRGELPAGVYVVSVSTRGRVLRSEKIVVVE